MTPFWNKNEIRVITNFFSFKNLICIKSIYALKRPLGLKEQGDDSFFIINSSDRGLGEVCCASQPPLDETVKKKIDNCLRVAPNFAQRQEDDSFFIIVVQ